MCGIIGTTNPKQEKIFKQCLAILHHRGPNETMSYGSEDVLLGMQRLSIQDLQKDLYPFVYKQKILIFNGEIYNLPELKGKIRKKVGYTFKSHCDAEVILPLITHFGIQSLRDIHGMFAIAIYDKEKKEVLLARDKFGEKPLYYSFDSQAAAFWFSSELKAFPPSHKTISPAAIDRYLQLGFLPDSQTVFEQIHKVKPGEVVTFNVQKKLLRKGRYFNVHDEKQAISTTENENLAALLEKIVSSKMISDVPIGSFLSGGVDSSLITALMKRAHTAPLHTFSISFKNHSVDESAYALQVSKYLHTNHHVFSYSSQDILKSWDAVLYHLDEPLCDPAVFPTYFLSKKAKKYVSVVLTGEGGDEFFGGYDRYTREVQLGKLRKYLPQFFKDLSKLSPSFKVWKAVTNTREHYLPVSYLYHWLASPKTKQQYLEAIHELWHNQPYNPENVSASLQLFDLEKYVAEQLCMKLDKMAMAHSLETRAPFLDSRLLPYLYASGNELNKQHTSKPLLKELALSYLPSEIVQRKKQGFSLPLKQWLSSDLSMLTKKLRTPHALLKELYGKTAIDSVLDAFYAGKNIDLTIWNMLIVDSWLKSQK